MKKVMMICGRCGGENVLADAYCSWNVETQEWEVANVFDKGAVCEDCKDDCRIEERELPLSRESSGVNAPPNAG
jgi:hypothetical protein